MVRGVGVEETPDHSLILRVVLSGLGLEEVDAALAEGDRDFDPVLAEDQVFGSREEITNDR